MDQHPLSVSKREAHCGEELCVDHMAGPNTVSQKCQGRLASSRPALTGARGCGDRVIKEEGRRVIRSG